MYFSIDDILGLDDRIDKNKKANYPSIWQKNSLYFLIYQ